MADKSRIQVLQALRPRTQPHGSCIPHSQQHEPDGYQVQRLTGVGFQGQQYKDEHEDSQADPRT